MILRDHDIRQIMRLGIPRIRAYIYILLDRGVFAFLQHLGYLLLPGNMGARIPEQHAQVAAVLGGLLEGREPGSMLVEPQDLGVVPVDGRILLRYAGCGLVQETAHVEALTKLTEHDSKGNMPNDEV